MKPLYIPKGKAKEYGDYAVNIFTGCPHGCFYCFAPRVLHRDKKAFHDNVVPREGIVDALKKQIEREGVKGQTIHLCFTCDPYPTGYDSTTTREVIQVIKESGNHVQILTKGDGSRDFNLLDEHDWYGITLDGGSDTNNPNCVSPLIRTQSLIHAYKRHIKTWVSFEPVLDAEMVLAMLCEVAQYADKVKIGKLNYFPSNINWAEFGREAEALCKKLGVDYYIKESLRNEMSK